MADNTSGWFDDDNGEDLLKVTVEEWDIDTYDFDPVIDRDDLEIRSPRFELPNGLDASADTLCEIYWSDDVIDIIVECSNAYARDHVAASKYQAVTRAEILRFMATLTYMGVVKLPAKEDYWPPQEDSWWPRHPSIHLNKTRFLYIWRTFHPTYRAGDRDRVGEETTTAEGEEEDNLRLFVDQEEDDDASTGSDFSNDSNDDYNRLGEEYEHKWYTAVKWVIKHVNRVSKRICKVPGSILSLDEVLRLFKGRSANTERMNRKPDKEGYKLLALADLETAFVYDFFPCGRLFKRKTYDHVKTLIKTLPTPNLNDYVVCMDNFFTMPETMKICRDWGVGAFGTARRWRGWSPMKDVDDDTFNTVHLEHDKNNYTIHRWVDNAEVLMVSNIHNGYGVVDTVRRRPRETYRNRAHVKQVWGTDGIKEMEIPEIIDDYNHWMNAVDLADQLISAFKPKFRCTRTWIPLFLQTMDIARMNSYVLCKKKETTTTHKKFVCDWISALNLRAQRDETQSRTTCHMQRKMAPPAVDSAKKRKRTNTKRPQLDPKRLEGRREEHELCLGIQQGRCRYCSYLHFSAKAIGDDNPPTISRPLYYCNYCAVKLCPGCDDLYHCRDNVEEV